MATLTPSPPVAVSENAVAETAELTTTEIGRKPVVVTTVVCVVATVAGNAVLWWASANDQIDQTVFWPPVFAIVVSVVALASFGGFYLASRRARVAIGASFILCFFVVMVFSLTITGLEDSAQGNLASDLIADFRSVLVTVIAFYFGSETAITVTKLITTPRAQDEQTRTAMGKLDRDLPNLPPQ